MLMDGETDCALEKSVVTESMTGQTEVTTNLTTHLNNYIVALVKASVASPRPPWSALA